MEDPLVGWSQVAWTLSPGVVAMAGGASLERLSLERSIIAVYSILGLSLEDDVYFAPSPIILHVAHPKGCETIHGIHQRPATVVRRYHATPVVSPLLLCTALNTVFLTLLRTREAIVYPHRVRAIPHSWLQWTSVDFRGLARGTFLTLTRAPIRPRVLGCR